MILSFVDGPPMREMDNNFLFQEVYLLAEVIFLQGETS